MLPTWTIILAWAPSTPDRDQASIEAKGEPATKTTEAPDPSSDSFTQWPQLLPVIWDKVTQFKVCGHCVLRGQHQYDALDLDDHPGFSSGGPESAGKPSLN
jgi:hypothetical protein